MSRGPPSRRCGSRILYSAGCRGPGPDRASADDAARPRLRSPVVAGVEVLDVVGILLAAGSGTRFGGDKLLAGLRGVGDDGTVGVTSYRNLAAAIPDVIAVVRPGDTALAAALASAGARVIECGNAADGMGASLACGVRASSAALGWIVALADMPWIRPETIAQVADALRNGAPLAAPFHAGERGHPVGFGNACRAELTALGADEGAKSVMIAHRGAMVRIDVDDSGVLRDVDTPQDLHRRW